MNDADLFLNVFNLTMVTLDDVDLRETNLDGIIYDPVALEFLASAKSERHQNGGSSLLQLASRASLPIS
jgi:hypothetical protein